MWSAITRKSMKVRTGMYDDDHHRVAFSVSFVQKILPKVNFPKLRCQRCIARPLQSITKNHCRIQFTGELWSFSRMEHRVLTCFRFRGGIFSQTNWCEGTFFSDQCGWMLTNVEEFVTIFRNRYHSLAYRTAAAATATLTSYLLPILIYSSCFWQNSSFDK